jgi:hypothetical protein
VSIAQSHPMGGTSWYVIELFSEATEVEKLSNRIRT